MRVLMFFKIKVTSTLRISQVSFVAAFVHVFAVCLSVCLSGKKTKNDWNEFDLTCYRCDVVNVIGYILVTSDFDLKPLYFWI